MIFAFVRIICIGVTAGGWLSFDTLSKELVALKEFNQRLQKVRYNLSYQFYTDTLQKDPDKTEQVDFKQFDRYTRIDYGNQKIMITHPDKYIVVNHPARLMLMDKTRPTDSQNKVKLPDVTDMLEKLQKIYNAEVKLKEIAGASLRCISVQVPQGDLHRMEYYYNQKTYFPEKLILVVRRTQVEKKQEKNDTTVTYSKIEARYRNFQLVAQFNPEEFQIQNYISQDSAGSYIPAKSYADYQLINHIK